MQEFDMAQQFKTTWSGIRLRAQAGLAFRADTLLGLLGSLLTIAWGILLFEFIYAHVDSIAGWDRPTALALIGTVALLLELQGSLFGGLQYLRTLVREGRLAQYLLRPIAGPWLLILRDIQLQTLLRAPLAIALLGYALSLSPQPLARVLLYGLSLGMSLAIYTLMVFCLVCLSFWLIEMNNLFYVVYDLMEFARFPVSVYHGAVRVLFVTVLPVALLSSFPVQLLMLDAGPGLLAHQTAVLLGFAGLAALLWRQGLRRYEGASS